MSFFDKKNSNATTKLAIIIFLILSIPNIIVANDTDQTIKVASFNVNVLGTTKIGRHNTLEVLADIATRFDILAMQEVGSNSSKSSYETCEKILKSYVSEVNNIAGTEMYAFIHGDQYAYIYRTDKIELISYEIYSGNQDFVYPPLIAEFESIDGNLDFTIITIHTSPSFAAFEIPALYTSVSELIEQYSEEDVVCLGDFNADGDYYIEGQYDSLVLNGFDGYITGIPNSADTTVASNDYTYDRIQMTSSMSSDYTNNWGVLIFKDYYDVTICEGSDTRKGTELALSDHYPVWVELFTDHDED
ncbi:MAG: endonuclease/exonuclease/phosphatase family protein [Spirochaetales bacterium]|nr:endonuclease/exonuclease/phosphatase family protein [Spirochaetales bacterium]